jgi:porin
VVDKVSFGRGALTSSLTQNSFLGVFIAAVFSSSIALSDNTAPNHGEASGVSPASVEETLKDDALDSGYRYKGLRNVLNPYFDFKNNLKETHGLAIGMDYNMLYQKASDTLMGEDVGFGGILRLYSSWEIFESENGSKANLVFKTENRHDLDSKTTPQNLAGQAGYAGLTGPQFGDSEGWILTNLFWHQRAADEKLIISAGIVDPTDYINIYGMVDPLKSFSNLAFLTGQTIAAPSQGLGAVVGWSPVENYYVIGGLYDANGNPSKPEDMFDSFFSDGEYFKQIEIGWFSSFERRYFDNVHLTLWQSDERESAGIGEDNGISFSATTFIDEKWMPFFRAGYADGPAALFQKEVNLGVGYYFDSVRDLLGFGLGWGEPSEDAFGKGVDDEKVMEVFYRLQVTPGLAITSDVQVVFDPSQNGKDRITVFGLRTRMDL